MRLISSDLALADVLALTAAGELALGQLARAVGSSPSGAQRALEILVEDGLVERLDGTRPVYRLRATETTAHLVGLAQSEVPIAEAVAISARANPALEFVALDDTALVVVFSAGSTALTQARAARSIEGLARRPALEVRYLDHDDVRRELLAEPQLRDRMIRTPVLYGDLDKTFPDRTGHGMQRGRPLHRPHPSLRLPSRYVLERLAREHRLASLELFGSAVRTDFRPDSDIDVLVRYRPAMRPSLESLIKLERELEAAFGRDVDLVREEILRPDVRERVRAEAVPLR
jgi:predicted nucleotidyltransferase/DNA-binding transcriptional ArsR family regulator